MTNDELQEHIRAIEGAVEAGQVQERFEDGTWQNLSQDVFLCATSYSYRIKPKPIEGWVVRGTILYSKCPDPRKEGTEYIRVREIVDE